MSNNIKIWKVSLLLSIGLFSFLYLFANTVADIYFIIKTPVAGLSYHYDADLDRIIVEKVVPKGPASRAGLQKGDVIVEMNGAEIKSSEDLKKAFDKLELRDEVRLGIIRNFQKVHVEFATERRLKVYTQTITLSLLPGLIFCYALCLIGIFVLLKKIHDPTAQLFYLMLLLWALAIRDSFPNFAPSDLLPAWFHQLLLPAWPLAVGLMLHFYLLFPVEKAIFRKYRGALQIAIYSPVLLLIPYFYAETNKLYWAGYLLNYGWGTWLTLYFLIALIAMQHTAKTAPTSYIRRQAQIMFRGTAVSLGIPLFFDFLPGLFGQNLLPYAEFTISLVILWPVTLAYVIVRHRFMGINFIITRGVAFALMSGFVIAAYFLLIVGVGNVVILLTGSTNQFVTIIATLLIAAVFNPVKNRVLSFVERRFYPARYTYREAFRAFSHELVRVVDLQRLQKLLVDFFSQNMKIRAVTLFWLETKEQRFLLHTSSEPLPLAIAPSFGPDDIAIQRLQQQQLVDLSQLKKDANMPSLQEIDRWEALHAELLIPLSTANHLVGVLSLGPKNNDEAYYREDLELLETLSDQIKIALQNALLTEELREQDRLKKELEVARRIQSYSLPQSDPQINGLEISGISIPAQEVGGDYYDYMDFPDGRFGVVIGDVSGKGTSAALYMSQLKGVLKTAAKYHRSLRDLFVEVNALTYKSIEAKSYITLSCAAFDVASQKLHIVRAGHLPVLHYSARQKNCRLLAPRGIGIGLENGQIFNKELEEAEFAYESGDVFLFYTDGITDAQNDRGDELDPNWLLQFVPQNGMQDANGLRGKIIEFVHEFTATAPQKDDMTLVIIKAAVPTLRRN